MYAQVLVEYGVKKLDKTFTYLIDNSIKDVLQIGMKVKVPFGKKYINGFVVGIIDKVDDNFDIKVVKEIVDKDLVLNDELLQMGKYLKELTLCNLITAYQTMLPSSLKVKDQKSNYNKYNIYISLNKNIDLEKYKINNSKCKKQIELINYLQSNNKVLKKEIKTSALKTLIEKGIVVEQRVKKYRIEVLEQVVQDNKLTSEQFAVYQNIATNLDKENTYLIYGVTGSGKTEVYIHLIRKVIKNKKRALVLVPEITLTTQIVKRFYERFSSKVAIFHSALSDGEKYDEYTKIKNNEVDVIVGTRSAVFTPINNLGIIIIDEEHSENYKQQNTPRYQTIDMAKFRSKYHQIPLVLGSATPSLESMARAKKNVYKYLELKSRIGSSKLPTIKLVDMQVQLKKRNMIFSDVLEEKIKMRLQRHEQIIILLNRRGYSTIITCQNCGYTFKCPHCDITLTYHKSSNHLRCHYCGYTLIKRQTCPSCNEEALNYYGMGTEKLENELKRKFPEARIVRMDVDTTTKKGAHDKIIKAFQNHDYDILIGTQMIAKGLDFKSVTLVGVVNADLSLNMPDFKARERTFSLLTQVAGRSGRSNNLGEVIIQTMNPDDEVLNFVVNNDYEGFYKSEMAKRHALDYPPYYYLVSIKVASKDYDIASKEANKASKYLKRNLNPKTIILGPTPANQFRINNIYRFQIIIKYKFDSNLNKVIKTLDELYATSKNVNLEIDMSALTI